MSSSEDLLNAMERLGVNVNSKIMAGFPNENEEFDYNENQLVMDSGIESPSNLDTLRFQESVSVYAEGQVTNSWKRPYVIVCSDKAKEEASNLRRQHQNQQRIYSIHVCKGRADLTSLSSGTTSYTVMWIIVDSQICDLFMRKRSFHTSVEDFFENFAKQSKVLLINRLPDTDDSRFQCFRWQLPEECLIEYREVEISSGLLSEEELMMTRGDSQYQKDLAEGGEPGPQDAADSESEHDVHDMTEGDYELSPRDENETVEGNTYVQVGSKCKMYIENSSQKWTIMRQDGTQNTIVLQIVAGADTSKVIVKITTDPRDQGLEERLEYTINQETEVINIKLKDAAIVAVKRGSVIIEIQVQPGQNIGSVWLQAVVESILTEKVKACLPSGNRLTLDIESNVIVPLADLGRYLSVNQEEFHKNCVSKEKYEQKVREVEKLKRSLNPLAPVVKSVSGDIAREKTDAIVNSTNMILKLDEGDISKCILDAAGPVIQDECRAKYPAGLEKGIIAKTGGGNLACRHIYHVFLPDTWDTDQLNTEQHLRDTVGQILHEADSDGHKTVSFPLLGTGNLHYDPSRVTDILTNVCSGFRGRSIQAVRLVHPDHFNTNMDVTGSAEGKVEGVTFCEESTSLPQEEHGEIGQHPTDVLNLRKTALYAKSDSPSKTKQSTSVKAYERPRTRISISVGDIMKQEVDVIVCAATRELDLNKGGLSKAILAEAGAEIQQELEESYPSGISEGQIAFTSGGGTCWKQIYFTALWPWEESELRKESFVEMILKCLDKVNGSQLRTIAFPLLGTSGHSYPPDKVTQWILEAIAVHDETYTSSTLTEVRVLVHPQDQPSLSVLQSMNMPDHS
ncbi:uncharacterized protein LOC124147196 isoform X1 [Haliotis rufescens]|uniref:uncharacterized protein LOC124147196 isoform X1 n=1 Tax=Haliotis rufescens TaxID=6454 RepID=UPI00201F686C|nr:uncharacterized protein LOC124147196 isoform X1 [Haliotis rufescens]XP_048237419.1 uncharacterized protein LOC124147196 isoform X1 [Haliotis rufescens]XP_048237420.1 uncharacterized protein LOC124147196 isoform X1 [Haliotis rufescens]XP_048237421.1 uncharacterized protein LOC124147196 isoform X1 [Haliotis rufescens]